MKFFEKFPFKFFFVQKSDLNILKNSILCNFTYQTVFLAAALAACSSSQYHVLVVLVVPELLSEFEFFWVHWNSLCCYWAP